MKSCAPTGAAAFDSFDSLAIAYVLPAIIPAWHIAPEKIGGLISIANFGQALGALSFGWLAERHGRVTMARIAIALFAVMSLACAFTQSYEQLFVCRFFEGIGLGGEIPVASTYISEILRADRRGGRFLSYQMIFPIGLSAPESPARWWSRDWAGNGCSLSARCRHWSRCSCSVIARNRRAGWRQRAASPKPTRL